MVVKTKANRILVSGSIVTLGSAGTGTSPCHTMLKTIQIWKGGEQARFDPSKRILLAKLASAIHLHTIAAGRLQFPTPVTATASSFLNPALAGDATYKFAFEIAINVSPGVYYAEIETESPSSLAGYTTAPTCNTTVQLEFEDQGIPFITADRVTISQETNTSFVTPMATQVAYLSATELSTVLSSLTYDKSYNAFQVRSGESEYARKCARAMAVAAASTLPWAYSPGNPSLVAGTVYYIFSKTNQLGAPASLQLTTATAVITCFYEKFSG